MARAEQFFVTEKIVNGRKVLKSKKRKMTMSDAGRLGTQMAIQLLHSVAGSDVKSRRQVCREAGFSYRELSTIIRFAHPEGF